MNQLFSAGIFAAIVGLWTQIKSLYKSFESIFIYTTNINPITSSTGIYFFHDFLTEDGWKLGIESEEDYFLREKYNVLKRAYMYATFRTRAFRKEGNHLYLYRKGFRFMWISGTDDHIKIVAFRGVINRKELVSKFSSFLLKHDRNYDRKTDSGWVPLFYTESGNLMVNSETTFSRRGRGNNSIQRARGDDTVAPPRDDINGDNNGYTSKRFDYIRRRSVEPINAKNSEFIPQRMNGFNLISMSQETANMIEDLRRWQASKDWYSDRGITWKKGVLLYGPPGTGKTSLVRAIAQELYMDVVSFDLASMSNVDFKESWENETVNNDSKYGKIVLIEDIDSIFVGRENKKNKEHGLSFDFFINTIDGITKSDGVLLIITTNNIDAIDAAIGRPDKDGNSTRPGRIDTCVYMGPLDEEGRRKIAQRILSDTPEVIEQFVIEGEGTTGAMFQEKCRAYALEQFWKNKNS